MLPEEIEDAAKEERQEFGRQEVFERRCNHPAGAAEVKCLDETDLERGGTLCRRPSGAGVRRWFEREVGN